MADFPQEEERLLGFSVIFEQSESNWAVYSPDLPGCVATGADRSHARENMREALQLHIEGLREKGNF